MSKPNAEALQRGLYVGAVIADTWDKKQYTIEGFDEDGDPTWGEADGNYAYNCELVIHGNIRELEVAKKKHQEVNGIKFKVSHRGEVLENAKYGIRLWTADPSRNDDWHSEYTDQTIGIVGYSATTREFALDKLLHNSERDFSNMKEKAIRHLLKLQNAYDKLPGNKKGS